MPPALSLPSPLLSTPHSLHHTGHLAGLQTCQAHACLRTLYWLLPQFLPQARPSLPTAFNWSSLQPHPSTPMLFLFFAFPPSTYHLLMHPIFYLFILLIICFLVLEYKVPSASFTHDSVLQFLEQGLAQSKYLEVRVTREN